MSQLIIEIKNESIKDKVLWMLEHFKNDGIEIKDNTTRETNELSDDYIENNYKEIVSNSLKNYDENYENSFEYKLDRADFIEMKGQN